MMTPEALMETIEGVDTISHYGKVSQIVGLVVEATLVSCALSVTPGPRRSGQK